MYIQSKNVNPMYNSKENVFNIAKFSIVQN
jgi:hypothetical protein